MLADPKEHELDSLVTLVNDRLAEGRGETILEVDNADGFAPDLIADGLKRVVQDDRVGALCQLLVDSRAEAETTPSTKFSRDIDATTARKARIAIGAASTSQSPNPGGATGGAHVLVFLIRHRPANVEEMLELRIAVAGNVDAGKSTMLGVLTQGQLDDGRGKARVALFRHKHEIESGRTSSVGMEILGYDTESGKPIRNVNKHHKTGWDEVCRKSSKLISFLDLAGHEKYLKTTVFGMAGGAPDFVMLMVAANAGLSGMAKEHLGLALALNVPVFVVITKIDMCPPLILDSTLRQLTKVLRSTGCRKVPIAVRDHASVISTAAKFVNQRICPIFQISNVTGEGVDCLSTFLNVLPLNQRHQAIGPGDEFRFEINETFTVPFVGTVVAGVVSSGKVSTGDTVWLGPDTLGHFVPATIKSIQRKRVTVDTVYAGQSASFGLKKIKRSQVRKGMVLLEKSSLQEPSASCTFEAEVVVLYHSTTIASRYQAMLHCGSVRQTARVLSIEQKDNNTGTLRTGDRATVVFQFIKFPEYLVPGARLIFREGRTKGVGKVTKILNKAEELAVIHRVTGGSMVLDPREVKARSEAIRHGAPLNVAETKPEHKIATKG
ncbi:hypothetical protein FBU59_003158 [Linderina macrospora]|uniref:Uncharacterized protein n=1 Tax=Linderina macrospora TaxID=4868 RepID=A0ACC1J995_9FUNG|nr:hypothetical protein FBU59_003158 [Linderina macrospora]